MALIVCPECKRDISDKAGICPNCGYPVGSENSLWGKIRSTPCLSYFGRLRRGEYPLRVTFWLCFFAVFFAANIIVYMFPAAIMSLIFPPTRGGAGIVMAGYAAYTAYLLICTAGVWRSAANYRGSKPLANAARIFICCYAVSSLYLTTSGFLLPFLKLVSLVN